MNISVVQRPETAYTVILNLIIGYKKFADDFSAKFPNTLADVVSYSSNPNCSCRHKIVDFIQKNFTEVIEWVDIWINSTPNDDKLDEVYNKIKGTAPVEPPKPADPEPPVKIFKHDGDADVPAGTNMFGRIAIIPPNPDAYYMLINDAFIKKWIFNGLTVSVRDTEWYVFFY